MRRLAVILLAVLPLLGCLPTAAPPPQPTALSSAPLPEGSRPGNLDGIFVSSASDAGGKGSRCHALIRFYPDGIAIFTGFTCFVAPPGSEDWSQVDRWFNRQNRDVMSGDYFIRDHLVWVRIVHSDPIHETVFLRSFQGEYCGSRMVLQEPAQLYFSGVPSPITQPVLEYYLLDASPSAAEADQGDCRTAAFQIIFRPTITLAGGQARYEIHTDPFETCILEYTAPDGQLVTGKGTGLVTADPEGNCRWLWDLGDTVGIGTVKVRIDEIDQEFFLEVR